MMRSGYPATRRSVTILSPCSSSANTTPTYAEYNGPSPTLWNEIDWRCQEFGTFEATLGDYLPSPYSVELEVLPARCEDVPWIRPPMRGRTELKKDIGRGVQRSMTTGSQKRKAVVEKVVSRAFRKLEAVNDDGNWDTQDFVDPRPAPAPPAVKRQPMEWIVYSKPEGEVFTRPGDYLSAVDDSARLCRGEVLHPVIPEPPKIESPRVFQQPTPEEVHRPLFMETPLYTVPKQKLGGDDIPLPAMTATCPLINTPLTGVPDTAFSIPCSDSIDSSMDHVYVQIHDCLNATERMDEVRFSSIHFITRG